MNKFLIRMKNAMSIILTLLMVVSNLAFIATAKAGVVPTLTIDSQSAINGANLNVAIIANDFSLFDSNVGSVTLTIQFDNTLLTYVDATFNNLPTGAQSNLIEINKIGINWVDNTAITPITIPNGALVTLNFIVNSAATINTNLSFVDTNEVTDGDFEPIITTSLTPTSFTNGVISLNPDTTSPSISSYTVSETFISPNNDEIKDSSSIDIAYSEEVSADINILDNNGVKVKDLYSSPTVTNPTSKVWDGNNNSNTIVPDGIYIIQILGTDPAGNTVSDTSQVIIVDTVAPVITLLGDSVVNLTIGNDYADAGATASDSGSDLTSSIVTVNLVNKDVIGTYTVTYNVSDAAGNPATEVTRTIIVFSNTEANILSFNSASPLAIGVINGTNITLTVPFDTSLTDLPIEIVLSAGATVTPAAGITTFTDGVPTSYTVTAHNS